MISRRFVRRALLLSEAPASSSCRHCAQPLFCRRFRHAKMDGPSCLTNGPCNCRWLFVQKNVAQNKNGNQNRDKAHTSVAWRPCTTRCVTEALPNPMLQPSALETSLAYPCYPAPCWQDHVFATSFAQNDENRENCLKTV